MRRSMCGNLTLMGRSLSAPRAVSKNTWGLLERMLRISQMRGAQSGGGAIQLSRGGEPRQAIGKCLNRKRGDLAQRLRATLERAVGAGACHESTFLVQAHVRYATASSSSKHEAHPFRFAELSQRGPRRITALRAGKPVTEVRPVETALTHNGDMDGMRFRGRLLGFQDLACLLERVLGIQNRWRGDSPVLAAAIELYLTRGMWLESLRLAYQLTVAPMPPELDSISATLDGQARQREVRERMRSHPAPSRAELAAWEAVAEQVLREVCERLQVASDADSSQRLKFREEVTMGLRQRLLSEFPAAFPEERCLAFARAAVQSFFDNDLYIALRKLEPALEGTFGCVVSSTLEPGCFVAMSRGQPLSLGFDRALVRVGVASERAALKVLDDSGRLAFSERLDLDLCGGEIARVEVSRESEAIKLTLYGISDGRESVAQDLVTAGRLVTIQDNPYVPLLPAETSDRVSADFEALAELLKSIRSSWGDAASTNRRTAEAFATALFEHQRPRLLLLGITNDLWLSQQFAKNLMLLFPAVDARAISSNEVLANPDGVPLSEDMLVLAVSQSGQDFPTLGALVLLAERAPAAAREAFFVLTGEVDSLLGQAVGQCYAKEAPFGRRIFTNLSGFRPSEAAIATVNATHHTLVELSLFLASQALDTARYLRPPLGLCLHRREIEALLGRRDQGVDVAIPSIVSAAGSGEAKLADQITRQARRWTRHVTEGIVAFLVAITVLELNLAFELGILPSSLLGLVPVRALSEFGWTQPALHALGAQANVLFYAFLAPLIVLCLRGLQRRPGLHRQGTRDLLIGDVGYVHQITWLLSKKLFSLSYGFASIKPYSANCQDELVMTHEPLRGTLMLLGVPDRGRPHLATRAGAALMAAKQFCYSRSLGGGGAEIVTISHAGASAGVGEHIQLPRAELPALSSVAEALAEGMFDSWERLVAMQRFLDKLSEAVAGFGPFRYDRSRTKDQVFAPTTAAPVSAAAIYQLLSRTSERYASGDTVELPFEVNSSQWRGSAPPVKTTLWRPDAILKELEQAAASRSQPASATPAKPAFGDEPDP